jgi:Tfp pilus assembly protein PilO
MSQASEHLTVSRPGVRSQFLRIRKSPARGMLGIAEIIALAIALALLLAVIVGYLYFALPAQSHHASLLADRDRLQKKLAESQKEFQSAGNTKATVQKIVDSIETFESRRLVDRNEGRVVLYEELNDLIHKNGLRNTSGPSYASLEPLGSKTQEQAAAASGANANKWQSIYPGIAVNLTVEGQYQNIRRFVRGIESSRQFIIINAVELERATESNVQSIAEASGPKGTPANALVSLRLDLATYYQPATRAEQAAEGTATH